MRDDFCLHLSGFIVFGEGQYIRCAGRGSEGAYHLRDLAVFHQHADIGHARLMGTARGIGDAGQALGAAPCQGGNQIIRCAWASKAANGNHRAVRNIRDRRIEIRIGLVARHAVPLAMCSLCFAEVAPMARG